MLTQTQIKKFWKLVDKHLRAMFLYPEWRVRTEVEEECVRNDMTAADVAVQSELCAACITLYKFPWTPELTKGTMMLENTAAHECLHILLSPLMDLAMNRTSTEKELDDAEHVVIRRLLAWKGLHD